MRAFGVGYQEDDNYFIELKPGDYNCKIVSALEKLSKSKKPMVEIKLLIDGGGKVFYYLVEDRSSVENIQKSNQRLTKFFDCFKIRRGNFNMRQWIGARGRVRLDFGESLSNGKAYIGVKSLLLPSANNTPYMQTSQPKISNTPYASKPTASKYEGNEMQNIQPAQEPQRKAYTNEEYYPTNEEIMQEAREAGLYVSEEYDYDENKPSGEAYDEYVYDENCPFEEDYQEPEIY